MILYMIVGIIFKSGGWAFIGILWNSMTSISFVFTELANTMKYGEGAYITLCLPSDVTAFHIMEYGGGGVI